ncbi:hypothetical protein GLAREA_03442 [Glarea lozoyensis ATCC 20868]|uniref:Uncharacterized protein n=1 Tax=Glarea lozoyensis (strain ATCC 20868 / MF5171) TaxID=1116229 RepID=S3CXY8_GLAL2|nr:uncharacterized protein GLAREA_03442 [Glarea lozoyensis ATCC 20868]EPE30475.1 hypothetical protein GLAREA_03442 [Glarea lozoyensis ATCC 20868]
MKLLLFPTVTGLGLTSPRFFPPGTTQSIVNHEDDSTQQVMNILSSVLSTVKKINMEIFFESEFKCAKKGRFCNDSTDCCGTLECDNEDLGKMPECKQF